ncbi:HNH endonuclease [Malaciobacter marinus]|nr:HNH endonuclease signature motif containing protein [Malaciobacter marinus]AXX86367.1 HNH endonuclease [Malaciobacter marinus]
MNNTQKKLISNFGIENNLAERISKQLTISKIKQYGKKRLFEDYNLNKETVEIIKRKTSRPPIPDETIKDLFYKSMYQCIICNSTSFVIHHIKEWHRSKSHDIDNLVLLCPNHHNDAHTTHRLAKTLSEKYIKDARKRHYEKVIELRDKFTFGNLNYKDGGLWYVNIEHILKTFYSLFGNDICKMAKLKNFEDLLTKGYINPKGAFTNNNLILWNTNRKFFNDIKGGMNTQLNIREYLESMVGSILSKLQLPLLHKLKSIKELENLHRKEALLLFKGNIKYTKSINNPLKDMKGTFKIQNFNFVFEYNSFYYLGNSASTYLLPSGFDGEVMLKIKSIQKDNQNYNVVCRIYFIGMESNSIIEF